MVELLPFTRLGLLWSLCSLLLADVANANSHRIIDNALGDNVTGVVPEYMPPNLWKEGGACGSSCIATPDSSMALHGTWAYTDHSLGDQSRYITIRFSGIAIYVYNIIANNIAAAGNMHPITDLSFVLDNTTVGNYTARGNPLAITQYDYNVNVLSYEGLEDKEHVLEIHAAMNRATAMVLFDYAVYTVTTTDPPLSISPSSSLSSPSPTASTPTGGDQSRTDRSSPAGAIIGSAVGGIGVGVLLTLLTGWLLRRRRARLALSPSVEAHAEHAEKTITPLPHSPRTMMAHSRKSQGRFGNPGAPAAPSAWQASSPQPFDAIAAAGGSSHANIAADEAPAVDSSLSGRARWDDAGTDSEYTVHSDGTATRMRTDIAVLREEVSRLRMDHARNSQDQEPPQYQERVVD